MASRFTAKSVGVLGTSYTLYIDDADFGGSSTDIEIAGISIAYDPDSQEDPTSPILSSSCTFTVNVLSSYQSDFNTFIDDLIAADEGRFMAKIENNVGNLYWVGFMIADQVIKEDQDYADVVSRFVVSAVDGISRLKDIHYNDDGSPYTGRETVHAHLFKVFDKLGTNAFWGATDAFLYVSSRWYEAGMGAAATDNPWELTFIDHDAFYAKDGNGGYDYQSCYDVLKHICRLFFSRLFLSSGVYRIDQISEYREATVTLHRYFKSGAKSAASTGQTLSRVESSTTTFIRKAGGKYLYFAPARRIDLTFSHRNDRNYLAGRTWTSNSTPAVQIFNVGRDGVSILFSGRLGVKLDFTPDSDFGIGIARWSIRVQVTSGGTDYYLKRGFIFNTGNGYAYQAAEWTTNSGDVATFFSAPVYDENIFAYTDISFETPEMPGSGELVDIEFNVSYIDYYLFTNGSTPTIALTSPTETWNFTSAGLYLVAQDESTLTEESVYTLNNADTPNASLALEYDTPIGDSTNSLTLSSTNALTVDSGAGAPGDVSSQWAKGTGGGGVNIQNLLLEEMMKLRKTALERYEGAIIGRGYFAHNTMELITGSQYALLRAEYNSYNEEWTGEWFYIGWSDSQGGTVDDPVHVPPDIPRIGSGPVYPAPGPGSGGEPAFLALTGGGHIVATTDGELAPNGAITSISIDSICSGLDNIIMAGDTISVYDPITGNLQQFDVTADVAGTDTSISISSSAVDAILSDGAMVLVDTCSFASNLLDSGRPVRYSQIFASTGSPTLTVTENGGALPSNTSEIEVYYGSTPIFETDDWTVSGSDIILAWNPEVGVKIRVFFWA